MLKKKLDYKWVILVAAFLIIFAGLGVGAGNKALYLSAVTEALNIKRSIYSLSDSCRYVATAIANMFFGVMIYRYGVRKMTAFGFAAICISNLIYSYAQGMVGLCIGGAMMGIGQAYSSTAIGSCIVRRWFKNNTGRYTGIVLAANGAGSAIAAKVIGPIIYQEGNPFGYRDAYRLIAVILFVIGVVVVALLREWPENDTLRVDAGKKARKSGNVGIDLATAKKQPYFYITATLIFLTGFIVQGIFGAYAAYMKDKGIDTNHVTTVASVLAVGMTFSKILIGTLYDRFGLRTVLLLCQGATVISFIILLLIEPSLMGVVLAIVFAVMFAVSMPLETLMIPFITIDMFGSASYDKILGLFTGLNYAGYALSAPIVNLFYDATGSYKTVLILYGVAMIVITLIFQWAITYVRKESNSKCVN